LKKALVIGATGLIGRNLVFELLKSTHYSKVTVLARRDLVIKHDKLHQILLDFDDLDQYKNEMIVDDVFCCLGSTKAKTPDTILYKKIDFDYPLKVAEIAKINGASQFLLVSSLGASVDSSIFYSKLKGEVEAAIAAIGYTSLSIFRPSLLLGSRNESRPLETITQYFMRVLNPLFIGPLKLYKAIKGSEVAKAMIKTAIIAKPGNEIILNNQILDLANSQ
jgi:uncharacterized protein YbjT (DUF2867 family)